MVMYGFPYWTEATTGKPDGPGRIIMLGHMIPERGKGGEEKKEEERKKRTGM